ncbi:MAG TPA: hypothetical protein V6D17_24950 [Candidatus Obscuribacterales bacterium]
MAEVLVFDRAVCEDHGEKQTATASEKLSQSSQQNSDVKCPADKLENFNVHRQISEDGSSRTRFPNGVLSGRGNGADELVPPPGGKFSTDKAGNTLILDASGKTVATYDKDDKEVHVYTKHGEYTESKDGKITYKPKDNVVDLQSLHKNGVIPNDKLEDYGISKGGGALRFPNGIEVDAKTGNVTMNTADHYQACESTETDGKGNVTKRTWRDGEGRLLFTQDKDGLHIPTADGTITRTNNGTLKFESNTPAQKALPKLSIDGKLEDSKMPAKKKMDPLGDECMKSNDPLCGLDLGEF